MQNHSFKSLLFGATAAVAILSGCSNTPQKNDEVEASTHQKTVTRSDTDSDKGANNKNETVTTAPEYQYRNFPPETLYSLLVAEYALRRGDYPTAVTLYSREAKNTSDPALAAYATRLAESLRAAPLALSSAIVWADAEPESAEARYSAATLLARQNLPIEAMGHMEWLLQNQQQTNFTVIAASAARQKAPIPKDVLERFYELLESYPKQNDLNTSIAILEKYGENYSTALSFAQKARKADSQDLRIGLLELNILQSMGEDKKALGLAEELAKKFPEDARLQLQFAHMLTDSDIQRALTQFQELQATSPNNPDVLFPLSLVALKLEQYDVAEDALTQLTSTPKFSSPANYYLGYLAEKQGDADKAISHLLQVTPGQDYPDAQARLVNLYTQKNQINLAITHLKKLQEARPEQAPQLIVTESEILSRAQQWQEALETLNQGIIEYPNNGPLRYARAMTYDHFDKIDLAEADLRYMLAIAPNDPHALNALGYTLTNRTSRHQEALQLISQALALKPDSAAILDSMGWVQYRLGNYASAITHLRKAYKLVPDHEIGAHLGEVLWVTGDQSGALQIWKQSLQKRPNSPVVLETIQRLQPQDNGAKSEK